MWKWLRNIVLAAVLVAGALKLLAWYAVGRDAQRVVAALEPYAQIRYDSLSAGLDGSVTVSGLSVAPAGAHRIYRADSLRLDSPGFVWLFKHALLHENTLPAEFGVSASGLTLPPESWLNRQWLDPQRFVLFPSAGCATPLADADFRRMAMSKPTTQARLRYRFDADPRTLDARLELSAPGYATLAIAADLSRFDPATLLQAGFWKKARLDQLSADYADEGFMSKRNAYCGTRERLAPTQFADRHIEAVRALLQQARIEPGEDVVKLYRNLLARGGHASLLSLPNPGFSPAIWGTAPHEELLRQLNVTARYANNPPIMLRMTFTPAQETSASAQTADAAVLPPMPVTASPPPTPSSPALSSPTPAAQAGTTAQPPQTEKPVAVAPAGVPAIAITAAPATARAPEKSAVVEEPAPPTNYLDRAEAKLTPPVKIPLAAPKPAPSRDETVSASHAPPPDDSTLALIWRPGVIEPLPEATPVKKDYSPVEFSALPQLTGRHVRLLTVGGKQIEGFVASADAAQVRLRIDRGGGDALIALGRDRIVQIQLLHW